jgi:hypothetical protein
VKIIFLNIFLFTSGSDGKMKSNSPILKNLTKSCGLQPVTSRSYRVVGGEVVGKHEWPWQV